MALTICLSFSLLIRLIAHPYYVSISELYYNSGSQKIEISTKIFIDDFEDAVRESEAADINLEDKQQAKKVNKMIQDYFQKYFSIEVNGEKANFRLIGYELEFDAAIFYLESDKVPKIRTIAIHNALITNARDEQLNINHFQFEGSLQSVHTTKNHPLAVITTKAG